MEPHRFSWDSGGEHKMLIADIGQAFIEEVNLGIKGASYVTSKQDGKVRKLVPSPKF